MNGESREHEGQMANQFTGQALSDSPALKPYRGKPAVRNFRGGDGNVGIIRSPVRAIALPDNEIFSLLPTTESTDAQQNLAASRA